MRTNTRRLARTLTALSCAGALTVGGAAGAATAAAVHGRDGDEAQAGPVRPASHWLMQIAPGEGTVILRNGRPPAGGRYRITLRVTHTPQPLTCFAERRAGPVLGGLRTVRAGSTVVLTTRARGGDDYNVICFGDHALGRRQGPLVTGSVTETAAG